MSTADSCGPQAAHSQAGSSSCTAGSSSCVDCQGDSRSIHDVIDDITRQEAEEEAEQTREELDCRTAGAPHVFLTDVDDELMFRIKRAGDPLVTKAASLIENRTSNLAECFMSLRTKMDGGKVVNRVQSGSFQHRCTATGLRVQLGPSWGVSTWEKVTGLEPGSILVQTASVTEREHLRDTARKRTRQYSESRAATKFKRTNDSSKAATHSYGENAQTPDISHDELRRLCLEFKEDLRITPQEAASIEEQTRDQANSEYWFEVRHRRITASNMGKVARRRQSTKVTNFVRSLLYESRKSSPAQHWGRDNEPIARKAYICYMQRNGHNISTQASGFVVCLDNPWLGCSPDDIVTDPTASASQTKGLAEYKCPYSLRDKTIDEHLTSKGAAQFCLSRESDGTLRLKKTHAYFYQVQGQLAVMNLPWCDFVLWTPKELHVERIQADPAFWREVLPKLEKFYDTALLPELASPRYPHGQPIREPTEIGLVEGWLN